MNINQIIKNKKIKYFITIAVIGIIIFLVYVAINIYSGNYWIALFESFLILILFFAIFLTRYPKSAQAALIISSLVLFAISIYIFIAGSFGETSIFWLFLFPSIIFNILGTKRGLYWSIFFISSLIITILLDYFNYLILPYAFFTDIIFLATISVVILLNYLYQYNQEEYQAIINEQGKKLTKEVKKSKDNLEEIKQKSENLEKMNRVMVGRELQMVKLKKELRELKK